MKRIFVKAGLILLLLTAVVSKNPVSNLYADGNCKHWDAHDHVTNRAIYITHDRWTWDGYWNESFSGYPSGWRHWHSVMHKTEDYYPTYGLWSTTHGPHTHSIVCGTGWSQP